MADPKIRYDIEAGVKGEQDVAALAQTVRTLGDTLEGDLKTQAIAAADALDNLGGKQRAVETFAQLKRETETLAAEMTAAAASVDRLAGELPQATAATANFAAAEKQARQELDAAQAVLDEQRQALAALRTEYTGTKRGTDAYKESNAQLLVTVKELRTNLSEKRAAVAAAAAATRTAATDERNLSTEYEKSVNAARKVSTELGTRNRALDAARGSLAAYGIETTNIVQAEQSLKTALTAVREEVNKLAPAFAAAATATSGSVRRQVTDQQTLQASIRGVREQMQRIQTIATVAVGGGFIGGLIKDVAETADEFKNLEARIKLAVGESGNFNAAFKGVQDVALATNSSLAETATLFARITKTGTDAGLSSTVAAQQALALTETINQAVQLSGSGADASRAALTQLIQGLQSGVLRGEEFNSVMEQAPRLAQALAQGLGVTTGELRKMAEQGALTSATVIKALTKQSDVVAAEFQKLPQTVGRSLQNLSTQWSLYVGAADNGMASSANLARIVDGLAKNLDVLVGSLVAAGKGYAAFKVAGLAVDAYKWATATVAATTAVAANTTAVVANTAAHGANAAAARASAAAGAANAATTTAATARIASAGGVLGRFSALLGPVGVGLAVLTPEIIDLGRWLGEGVAKWQGYGKAIADAEGRMRAQEEATKANAAQQRAMAIALQEARDKQFELSKEALGLIGRFDEMRTKGDSAADAIAKIGRDFDLESVPGIANAGAVLDKLLADGKLTATQFQAAWSQALKGEDLAVFETRARAAFAGAAREGERLVAVFDASAREAIRRTGLDFDVLAGKIGAASRSAINDTDAIVNNLDRLKAAGVDTGLALTASLSKGIDTADSQKAIEAVRAQIRGLRSQLGDQVTDGLLTRATQQAEDLRVKLDQLRPGIQNAAEGMKFFGLASQQALAAAATSSREAYDAIKNSGTASADQLRQAFQRVAADAIAANKGIAPAWLETEDAILRAREETEHFGRSTTSTLDGLKGKWREYGDTVRREGSATPGVIAAGGQEIKSVTGDSREERLKGQNAVDNSLMFTLRDKLKAGALGEQDLGALKTVIGALRQNEAINGSASKQSAAFMSLEGARDSAAWAATRAQFEQVVKRLEKPVGAARSTKHEVELTVPGGDTGSFNVESEDDAQKLIGLLGRAKGRSA